MAKVVREPGESEDRLIARFRKKALDEEIVQEARKLKEFIPKSQLRKEKKYRLKFYDELKRKRES